MLKSELTKSALEKEINGTEKMKLQMMNTCLTGGIIPVP